MLCGINILSAWSQNRCLSQVKQHPNESSFTGIEDMQICITYK